MRDKMKWSVSAATALALTVLLAASSNLTVVLAQDDDDHPGSRSGNRTPSCTNATATGTYGYRMNGIIVGVGPFLVNGIYTHKPDGTMNADVQLIVGNQSFPGLGNGTFRTNSDCTGSGKFAAPALNLEVTYNFIVTDGGDQIELLNTNPGVVLQGISRRISKPGRVPSCEDGMILGTYGYRLEGSLPGFPNVAGAGILTHRKDHAHNAVGTLTGADTLSFMGQYAPRALQGTFKLESNCRGSASYTDSLGNHINYVFTVVNDGDTLFLQGADSGTAISGVAQRVQ